MFTLGQGCAGKKILEKENFMGGRLIYKLIILYEKKCFLLMYYIISELFNYYFESNCNYNYNYFIKKQKSSYNYNYNYFLKKFTVTITITITLLKKNHSYNYNYNYF